MNGCVQEMTDEVTKQATSRMIQQARHTQRYFPYESQSGEHRGKVASTLTTASEDVIPVTHIKQVFNY